MHGTVAAFLHLVVLTASFFPFKQNLHLKESANRQLLESQATSIAQLQEKVTLAQLVSLCPPWVPPLI
jgi:hypothetical protein